MQPVEQCIDAGAGSGVPGAQQVVLGAHGGKLGFQVGHQGRQGRIFGGQLAVQGAHQITLCLRIGKLGGQRGLLCVVLLLLGVQLGAQRVALGLGLGELCARLLEGVLKRVVLVQQLLK